MRITPFPGVLTSQMVERPFITKLGNAGCIRVRAWVLTEEQEEWLRRWFPEVDNNLLIKESGMSHSTLHRFAREYGLKKSEAGMKRIKKQQAAHIKKLCEKNGYYDSLRGHPVSEACRRATSQMWQDIRDGKREHPIAVMKRENPRKYHKWMLRKSRERRETIRKERLRMKYGIPRKTRLKMVVLNPYTRRQTGHRYNALKRGYYVMEDCSEQGGERWNIYYDEYTQRSAVFERNLKADGFRVIEGPLME